MANISQDNNWWEVLDAMMQCVPAFTLVPRLILSLRKLCACDSRRRRGSDIDSAFGLTPSNGGIVVSEIMFAVGGQEAGGEQGEEVAMEQRETVSAGSGA